MSAENCLHLLPHRDSPTLFLFVVALVYMLLLFIDCFPFDHVGTSSTSIPAATAAAENSALDVPGRDLDVEANEGKFILVGEGSALDVPGNQLNKDLECH